MASLMTITDDLTKARARANKTFTVQASLTIITYNCQNFIIIKATGELMMSLM